MNKNNATHQLKHQMVIFYLKLKLQKHMASQKRSLFVPEYCITNELGQDVKKLIDKDGNSYVLTKDTLKIIAKACNVENKTCLGQKLYEHSKMISSNLDQNILVINKLVDRRDRLANSLQYENYSSYVQTKRFGRVTI